MNLVSLIMIFNRLWTQASIHYHCLERSSKIKNHSKVKNHQKSKIVKRSKVFKGQKSSKVKDQRSSYIWAYNAKDHDIRSRSIKVSIVIYMQYLSIRNVIMKKVEFCLDRKKDLDRDALNIHHWKVPPSIICEMQAKS